MNYNIPKIKRQRWCKTKKVYAELKLSEYQLYLLYFAVKNLPLETLYDFNYQTEVDFLMLRDRLHCANYWCEEENICDYTADNTCPICKEHSDDPKNGEWLAPMEVRFPELGIV